MILAAGQGTRMKSETPKVLHAICGRPLIHYPVRAAIEAGCQDVVVVVGHGRERVEGYLREAFGTRIRTALQAEQRGTGDAVQAGLAAVSESAKHVLIFYGDVPLMTAEDLQKVAHALEAEPHQALALATCVLDNPHGYGRVLRKDGKVIEIREQKDLRDDAERAVREINPGIYLCPRTLAAHAVKSFRPNNAQGELYLTDIVALVHGEGKGIVTVPSRAEVLIGVNDRRQLNDAEVTMARTIANELRAQGVTVREGARIDDGVEVGQDAILESGVVLRGNTKIGKRARIDVGSVLTNVTVEEDAEVKPYSVATNATIGARAQVGPFSHLRPDSHVGEEAHLGNFVEMKKTRLEKGAKANHLAYLGDGIIGEGANIGAGTIFCNYDGYRKHTTTIGKGAFIGSDSQLVAPVTVGDGAYVATGTCVTRDVPRDALAIARTKQENKEGYATRLRARLKG